MATQIQRYCIISGSTNEQPNEIFLLVSVKSLSIVSRKFKDPYEDAVIYRERNVLSILKS